MKNFFKSKGKAMTRLAMIGGLFAISPMAFADCSSSVGFAKVMCNISNQFNSVGDLAANFFYLLGFIFFGAGLLLLKKEGKQQGQDHGKNGGISMIIGVALILITFLVNMFATSLKGSSVSDSDWKIGNADI